jgi:hypothetical protein
MERAVREARSVALEALAVLEKLWGTSVMWVKDPNLMKARKHLLEAEYQLREALARLDDAWEQLSTRLTKSR